MARAHFIREEESKDMKLRVHTWMDFNQMKERHGVQAHVRRGVWAHA